MKSNLRGGKPSDQVHKYQSFKPELYRCTDRSAAGRFRRVQELAGAVLPDGLHPDWGHNLRTHHNGRRHSNWVCIGSYGSMVRGTGAMMAGEIIDRVIVGEKEV